MKRKEIITMTAFSIMLTVVILIWQGIGDLLLAIVTLLIIACLVYITFHGEAQNPKFSKDPN